MKWLFEKLGVHNKDEFIALIWQFVKFGIVGISNTLISLAIYYIFIWINKDLYMWGNVIGWIVSVANSFFWNNKFVFKSEKTDPKSVIQRLLKSYLTYGGTFLLSTLLLFLEVKVWGVNEWLAPIVNLLITIPLNFVLNKLWTFRK